MSQLFISWGVLCPLTALSFQISSLNFVPGFSALSTMLLMFYRFCVKYHGKASHASAYPWEGVNALDAAVLAYNNMSVLRQQLKPDWKLQGEERLSFQNKVRLF